MQKIVRVRARARVRVRVRDRDRVLVRVRVRFWVRVRVWVRVWGSGPIMNARTGALSRKLRRKLAPELKMPKA